MNDNSVVFAETYIRLNISENTSVGTELTRINATDKDIGLNGKVKSLFCFLKKFCLFTFDFDRFIIRLVMVFHHLVGWIISELVIQLECTKERFGFCSIKIFTFFSLV